MAWDSAVITNAGTELLKQCYAGEKLILDYATGGTGTVAAEAMLAQTALKEQKQQFSIVQITEVTGGQKVNVAVDNQNLTTGYAMQQLGIWAHIGDGAPVLLGLLQDAAGIQIPSNTEIVDFSLNFYAVLAISGDAEIQISMDVSALVSEKRMNERLAGKSDIGHKHGAGDITRGTLDSARLPTVPISKGGTGATTVAGALTALGAAAASHNHSAGNITSGTLDSARLPTVPVSKGGTGATTAAAARANLGAAKSDYEKWSIPYGAWRRYDTGVSTDVLAIATGDNNTLTAEKNQPATIMTEDASTLTNSPVTSGGFWARRTVYPVSNPTGSEHITVELEEYEPVLGRRWLRTYYAATGKWSEKWVEISPVSPLDQMVSGSSANINDYTGAGLYWLNKTTVTNTPNGGSGMLIVTTSPTGNVIYQTFVTFNTSSGYIATRCYTNSQWYPWDERPAPASYVTQEGTSGAWRYRIWSDGKKECWLKTSIQHEVKQASGSLYYSSTVPYPYPVTFTATPTVYVGVRSPNNRPIWGIPSTPASDADTKSNAYMEFVATVSTTSITSDIYIYACGV